MYREIVLDFCNLLEEVSVGRAQTHQSHFIQGEIINPKILTAAKKLPFKTRG